jgi:hypothetical protein
MSRKTIYLVSVLNQRTRAWMRTVVFSMADCVRLTVGLETHWNIETPGFQYIMGHSRLPLNQRNYASRKYQHTLRALASRAGVPSAEYSCLDSHMFHVVRFRPCFAA